MAPSMKTMCCRISTFKVLTHSRKYCQKRNDRSQLIHNLSKQSAWETHYAGLQGDTEDWFLSYKQLKAFVKPLITKLGTSPCKILDFGCGLSDISMGLYGDKTTPVDITCVDFSKTAIQKMKQRHLKLATNDLSHAMSTMQFRVCDVTSLLFADSCFDLVLDKGTLDAVMRDKEFGVRNGKRALEEAYRVLVHSGSIVQFTDEDPESRLLFVEETLNCSKVSVSFKELGTYFSAEYFMFIIKKLT